MIDKSLLVEDIKARMRAARELKPCPFCGHKKIDRTATLGSMCFSCNNCGAKTRFSVANLSLVEQIQLFNTRPSTP